MLYILWAHEECVHNICYDSRLKVLSQETTLVLEWHKRTL